MHPWISSEDGGDQARFVPLRAEQAKPQSALGYGLCDPEVVLLAPHGNQRTRDAATGLELSICFLNQMVLGRSACRILDLHCSWATIL
jgi:hypothetical protein